MKNKATAVACTAAHTSWAATRCFLSFYPSGKLKSVIDQRQTIGKPLSEAVKIQKEFNEKGELVKEVVTDAKAGAATTKFYGENGEIIKTETINLR